MYIIEELRIRTSEYGSEYVQSHPVRVRLRGSLVATATAIDFLPDVAERWALLGSGLRILETWHCDTTAVTAFSLEFGMMEDSWMGDCVVYWRCVVAAGSRLVPLGFTKMRFTRRCFYGYQTCWN
jgi:hypothetical protein